MVYGDSNGRGSSHRMSLLPADNFALADNLGTDPTIVIYPRKLKPKI
jgi:hypothetical protein